MRKNRRRSRGISYWAVGVPVGLKATMAFVPSPRSNVTMELRPFAAARAWRNDPGPLKVAPMFGPMLMVVFCVV